MADAKHLKALTTWPRERWNSERPDKPNLRSADLSEANLSEANLSEANLSGADLSEADLSEANLSGADLSKANLSGAYLTRVYLTGANLTGSDLRGADLSEADLSGADLRRSNLTGAHLTEVDLRGADLSEANLSKARLAGVNLHRADLSRADLSGADLSGADLMVTNLTGADLSQALLFGARLTGTNLSQTRVTSARSGGTNWDNLNLRDVIGLDQIIHKAPSSIGVDTLYLSDGRIPAAFLRGCGLPDYFIGMVPGLTVSAPIQHFSAFISYSHADQAIARRIYDHLFHVAKIPTWLDEHEIHPGDLIMRSVDQAIRRVDKVILLCSEVALNSWWVREEIERWTTKERELSRSTGEPVSVVIPVDLDGHLADSSHEYAVTIRRTRYIPAQTWDTDPTVVPRLTDALTRALRRDRRSPFDILAQAATELHVDPER